MIRRNGSGEGEPGRAGQPVGGEQPEPNGVPLGEAEGAAGVAEGARGQVTTASYPAVRAKSIKIFPRLLREQKRQMEEVLLKRGEVVGLDRDGGDDDREDYGMRFTLMIPVHNRSSKF